MAIGRTRSRVEAAENTVPDRTGVVDVSEMRIERIRAFARRSGDVHFERRGDRTYLVAAE